MPISGTPVTDILEEKEQLRQEYEELLSSFKWIHAVASILIELEGGQTVIPKDVISNYDLRSRITLADEGEHYVISVIPYEEPQQ